MPNRTYDLVVLLDADAPSETRGKIVHDTQALIKQHGDVKADKDWGTRQTPYRIDHHEEAAFHVFKFETNPEAIAKLDRGLKLTEGVLRFRIFQTDSDAELPPAPPNFKREERAYERPPANVAATPELDDEPVAVPAAPVVEMAPASEATPAEIEPTVDTAVVGDSAVSDPVVDDAPADAPVAEPAPEAVPEAAEEAPAVEAAPETEAETPGAD